MYRIVLVDDMRMWTDLFATVFTGQPNFQLISTLSTETQLWGQLTRELPDLLLLDLVLSNSSKDLALARQLKKTYPTLRIVLLTSSNDKPRLIQEAYQMGLDGYISKHTSADELMHLLEQARQGERVFSADIREVLVQLNRNDLPRLTPKEQEILTHLDLGMKRASIMEAVRISNPNTYDAHLHNMKQKFGATSTSELLQKAADLGYI